MAPLILQVVSWLVFRAAGAAGVDGLMSWTAALRYSMAAMFLMTGAAHFVPRTRDEMIQMVPPAFPRPAARVALTGVSELAGAAGLLVPGLKRFAAWALAAQLVAMFPANVHAARTNLSIAGRRAEPLWVRLPMQIYWIGALVVVAIGS
jgi:uncharacterized membrane protein